MATQVEIYHSIDAADLAAWDALRRPGIDPFMDPRFLQALERTAAAEYHISPVLVRDGAGRPLASACVSTLSLDLAVLAGGNVRRAAGYLRRILPGALRYPALFCGLPVSAGQSHLRLAPGVDAKIVLPALVSALEVRARAAGARFLIFKEFDDQEANHLATLSELGFFRGESSPMNHFPTRFKSFDEYCRALKAPYRSKIVRSQRKFADQGLRAECLTDGEAIAEQFSDEAHRLYLDVVARSPLRLETLTADWFREMARAFVRESVWLAIYDGPRLLSWAYGLLTDGVYHSLFGGVNYARNADTDAYFNLMYHELAFALEHATTDIQLGQTADDFKARLGATQSRRWYFVKPLRWKARAALQLAHKSLLPEYLPPLERHVFRNG